MYMPTCPGRASLPGARWWNRTARLARMQRLDVLVDSPLGFEEWAAARFRDFGKSDYRLVTGFLAVHEATSLQGMVYRLYEERSPDRQGFGRFPPVHVHDALYRGVLDAADRFDESGHEVYVLRRGPEILHHNERRADGTWERAVDTRQVVMGERSRIWSGEESSGFLQRQSELREFMSPEWHDVLDDADVRAAGVMNPLVLLDDTGLADHQRRTARSLEVARQSVGRADEYGSEAARGDSGGESARRIERLRELGATPEELARVVESQREDRRHAGAAASVLRERVGALERAEAAAGAEVARRAGLDPKRQDLEQQGRQLHLALSPARPAVVQALGRAVRAPGRSAQVPGQVSQAPRRAAQVSGSVSQAPVRHRGRSL
ncbi:zeta toxin family protein [Streptomyces sp. NPDC058045]|uniref:zeta toxin family protein n=1 Tax=Streptomyces sp. NPDC058045 TaxID=3346311 RepID=UPI0036F06B56